MDKYTLKTIFERSFSGVIWRIEADTAAKMLAVESRSPDGGLPAFSVIRYTDGHSMLQEGAYGDRHWTLAGMAGDCLLLRALGEREPNAPGIACLSASTGEVRWESFNHTFVAVAAGRVQARPRHIASGRDAYLSVQTGQPIDGPPSAIADGPDPDIRLPEPATSVPDSLSARYAITGPVHHLPFGDKEAWAFHVMQDDGLDVKLIISQHLAVLEARTIMAGLAKMTPEVFFAIGRQLFFIASNKQEIVSYLV